MATPCSFPSDIMLKQLLRVSQQRPFMEVVVHDVMGFEKSYADLVADVLSTRTAVLQKLPPLALNERGLLHHEAPYMFIVVKSGYEFLVGLFAIRALGGAAIPLANDILPEQAYFWLKTTRATCILYGKDCDQEARNICDFANSNASPISLAAGPISSDAQHKDRIDVKIDHNLPLDDDSPGLAIFSSGTTGDAKAVCLPRTALVPLSLAEPDGISLNYRPYHWVGAADSLIEPVLSGKILYSLDLRAPVPDVMQAFVDHRVTRATFYPTYLKDMKDLITDPRTGTLSEGARKKYCTMFRGLRSIMVGSRQIEASVRQFWVDLTGKPFECIYAVAETGMIVSSEISGPTGCIGSPWPGAEMKLVPEGIEGLEDLGEIRVKSKTMMTHYIGREESTRAAFDEDGFYKTSDLGKVDENGKFFIFGRKGSDYVQFKQFYIPTIDAEHAVMELPYVSDACVVGVPNTRVRELCAVVLKPNIANMPNDGIINLAKIRSDLAAANMSDYMLPLVLRVLKPEEELPRTLSGKLVRKRVFADYFGDAQGKTAVDAPHGIEIWPEIPFADDWGVHGRR
ncbi:adenylate-forming enzyme AfeA [Rhizodiscina lignyota]|uniref:Adenylate-forming enzyme AfeA n=1 Tax=Rhizodiscina lignyota TaxID=1504668 RepID=A0A9P4I3Z1_9PEZI|nr:adenylate-forming enzyme AfeA [Rhizodiscina lignyota]